MAPLILALVIGPMLENNLCLSLIISRGNPMIFLKRPLSATFLLLTAALLLSAVVPWIARRRRKLQAQVEEF